jgi:hypothetical protein
MEYYSDPGSTQAPEPKISPELAKELSDYFKRIAIFCNKESTACPYCGKTVSSMEKRGQCVYLLPCNCRLWNGEIPEKWRTQDE